MSPAKTKKVKQRKRIDFDFTRDQVKVFNRDFKPEDKVNLWTTSEDVKKARREELLERAGLDPIVYGNVKYDILLKLTKNANEKHEKAKDRKQYVRDTLAKLKEEQKDYITLKRQPPLTKGMLQSFQSTKKGGKLRIRFRKTKKIFG